MITEALNRGVEITGNEQLAAVQREIMQIYPYFQKKIEDRKQALRRVEKQVTRKKQTGTTIDTTTDPTPDLQAHYSKLLSEYESDRKEIERLQQMLPEQDAITPEDEQEAINSHLREEQLETKRDRQKPDRQRRAIDDVVGSDIPAVSRRMGQQAIIDDFRQKIEKQLNQN